MENNKLSFLCLVFTFIVACSVAVDEAGKNVEAVHGLNENVNAKVTVTDKITLAPSTDRIIENEGTTSAPASNYTSPSIITDSNTPTTVAVPNTSNATVAPTQANSTTEKPHPPSTTPIPPEVLWIVKNSNTSEICILMKSKVTIKVSYTGDNSSKKTAEIIVPNNVNASGSCDDNNSTSPYLTLTWNQTVNNTNNITFTFHTGTEDKCEYFLSSVNATVYVNAEKNATELNPYKLDFSGKTFVVHKGSSYTCNSPQPLKLSGTNYTGELLLTDLQYEAYHENKDKKFSSAQDCIPTETPDIVPFLVAGALILLVVLVLAAYVITRKRSRDRGYVSM